jgi:beta-glucosidase-like glycosyl hydrolase
MDMPGDVTFGANGSYFGANLTQAVNNGSVPLERLDDMATRILGGYFLLGQDSPSFPNVTFDAFDRNDDRLNDYLDVRGDHGHLIREIGAASTVLLKNVNGTLPLYKPKTLAVFGSDAGPASNGPNGNPDRGGFDGVVTIGEWVAEITSAQSTLTTVSSPSP